MEDIGGKVDNIDCGNTVVFHILLVLFCLRPNIIGIINI